MLLSQLLSCLGEFPVQEDFEVTGVTNDSRRVEKGSVFVCIEGLKLDGHAYAAQALEKGAGYIVAQRDLGLPNQLLLADTHRAYALLCGRFHGDPARQLKLIAVTGTNGKTTITYLIKHILESLGKKVGLVGTIQNEISGMDLPAKYTTPEPGELHALFRRMVDAGCEYVVMEASSNALDQRRLDGCYFETAIFTNLTQDHLDYHGTMENYYQAKKKLFSMCGCAIFNWDDAYGRRLASETGCPFKTYSAKDDTADYSAKNIRFFTDRVAFDLLAGENREEIRFQMPGLYSVSNALATASCLLAMGFPFAGVAHGLCTCPGVRGRMEVLPVDAGFTVICDYAHSPDGLEKSLGALSEVKGGRLVVLFGCAGNRDRSKRRLMASAVAKYADFAVLTSDNPRDEDPLQIIEDAMPGFQGTGIEVKVIPDRYEAILWALQNARAGDLLVLAGKGHEDYQVLADCTIYFDEHVIVKEMAQILKQDGKLGGQ